VAEDVLESAYVVGCVADCEGFLGKRLPTSHQSGHLDDVPESALDGNVAYLYAPFAKQTDGGENGPLVLLLAETSQRGLKVTPPKGELEGA